jgi:hypothetical protein
LCCEKKNNSNNIDETHSEISWHISNFVSIHEFSMFGTDNMAPWHRAFSPRLGPSPVPDGRPRSVREIRWISESAARQHWVNWYNVRPPNVMWTLVNKSPSNIQ